MAKLQNKHKMGLAAALTVAIGVGGILVVDTEKYSSAVKSAREDAGARTQARRPHLPTVASA